MTIGQAKEAPSTNSFDLLDILSIASLRKRKTHDYTTCDPGVDYIFEAVDHGTKAYMTGQRRGVKKGDLVVLKETSRAQYRVEQIDYYSAPSDMWVALLIRES